MDVLVTGASGAVGSAVAEGLADRHSVTCLDRVEHPEYDTTVVDVRDYEALRPAFDGQDAVVHAAFNTELNAGTSAVRWSPSLVDNLRMTTSVVRAAVDAGLETVVHCSSNHVVGMYEKERAPALYALDDDTLLDHRSPPRPDSLYAVEKLFEEGLLRFVAEWYDRQAYTVRIGNVRPAGADSPYAPAEAAVESGDLERGSAEYERRVNRMKAVWFSRRDVAHMCERCLASDRGGFEVLYGVSDNDRRWLDIEHAREVVGYEPRDNGERERPPGRE